MGGKSRMDFVSQSQKEVPQDLRKQLALAVRTIQWSYAIFWSISCRKPGVLEWSDGYYNGEIKTRKTVQASESDADQLGLQRSDQLRELFESLSLGETSPQTKRPTAALSPEDLTDAEWYFLVCMSFAFNPDQGLPGRTFAKNQVIWLCNAHRTDTKVFARSLLAKSASIQTIVCFPHLGGVVELGTTELVLEDLGLLQHIKSSLLEGSPAAASQIPNHVSNNVDNACEVRDHGSVPPDRVDRILDYPDRDTNSPNNSSDDFADNILREESNVLEGVDGEASQMQSWRLTDDAISNCRNNSMTSSDCVSQTYGDAEAVVPNSCARGDNNQECNQQIPSGLPGSENHYHMVLSNLLKSSHEFIFAPYFSNGSTRSSFVRWRNDGFFQACVPLQSGNRQILLKKVLFDVARMHENSCLESGKNAGKSKPESEEIDRNHVLSERKRREKINERFAILGSLVPSGGKVDKVSILDHTIEYLRDLERKVEDLESSKAVGMESTMQIKAHDAIERTSDNYGPNKTGSSKKQSSNKRKACETIEPGNSKIHLKGAAASADNITVNVVQNDVVIEIRCLWRENVLLEVMAAVSELRLVVQTVQSSDADGILSLSVKAKSKGLKAASEGVIRQTLEKISNKC